MFDTFFVKEFVMKKIIAMLLASVVAFTAVAEEAKGSLYAGAGLSGLYSNLNVKDDGSRSVMGGGLNLGFLSVNNLSGLTSKIDCTFGASSTADIPNEDRLTGFLFAANFEMGYSFIRSEDTVLSLLGVLSATSSSYNGDNENALGFVKLGDENISLVSLGIGADVAFIQRISNNLHFYASANTRYIWSVDEDRKLSSEDDGVTYYTGITRTGTGKIEVQPTLGVMWKIK